MFLYEVLFLTLSHWLVLIISVDMTHPETWLEGLSFTVTSASFSLILRELTSETWLILLLSPLCSICWNNQHSGIHCFTGTETMTLHSESIDPLSKCQVLEAVLGAIWDQISTPESSIKNNVSSFIQSSSCVNVHRAEITPKCVYMQVLMYVEVAKGLLRVLLL